VLMATKPWPRKRKLDVYMKSGAVIRLHVTTWTITYGGGGRITNFNWSALLRHKAAPITIDVAQIDAIVLRSRAR
jgi:hypothetical protein